MLQVLRYTFNPFQENTYVVYDDISKDCLIFDPGMHTGAERQAFADELARHGLRPVRLINTHGHLDHVFGNRFVYDQYGLLPEIHAGDLALLQKMPAIAAAYGLPPMEASPEPARLLEAGSETILGGERMDLLFTPGHSPGSVSFYFPDAGFVIVGDVLFYGSIGRTDLPGGDHETLLRSIREQLFPLGDAVRVLSGHGPGTDIGHERRHNPFLS